MPPAPKPRADIFWIKLRVWTKAQHVLAPPAPEALAPMPHKETLVTAGGGQSPETGPDGGAVAREISHLRPLFSASISTGRQTKERKQRDPKSGIHSSCSLPLPGPALTLGARNVSPQLHCLRGSHSHTHLASAKDPLSPETTASGKWCYQGGLY